MVHGHVKPSSEAVRPEEELRLRDRARRRGGAAKS
jgi:hypothetical protein